MYDAVKPDVHLASISGGTDIVSCFVGGNPNAPVWRGEIQCAALGMDVDVFDDAGKPAGDEPGELVCLALPDDPIGFWGDTEAARTSAYFERFPGVWAHGDCGVDRHGGMVIYGRSDATLNASGVRIGTAEIYRQVEQLRRSPRRSRSPRSGTGTPASCSSCAWPKVLRRWTTPSGNDRAHVAGAMRALASACPP